MATTFSIHSEVLRLFGELDGHKVAEIVALNPSLYELEITAAYIAGVDDVMGKERLALTGKSAKLYEIATRDELTAEDQYRRE